MLRVPWHPSQKSITGLKEDVINEWYENFKTDCPNGMTPIGKEYIFPLPRNAFPREGTGVKTDFFSARKFHFPRS